MRDWVLPDGRARVQALPKGDPNDTKVLRTIALPWFHTAEPERDGARDQRQRRDLVQDRRRSRLRRSRLCWRWRRSSIFVCESPSRRSTDVPSTLGPAAGGRRRDAGYSGADGEPLNFANIIALPLLLGVGVAFKIYYIMAWRAGTTGLLQSTLTRAVVFSA